MFVLRYAVRQLLRSPGFTAISLLTLALGIGVNTSMFSVLNALLLRSLPYPDGDRLVRVYRTAPQSQTRPHAPANFLDYRTQSDAFEHLAAFWPTSYNAASPGQPPLRLHGLNVSAQFFSVLGIQPALGRVFTTEEDQPGRNAVVVLSHAFWQSHFAADPAAIGREIRLNGEFVTVIGVMPPGFDDRLLWGQVDVWRPLALPSWEIQNRSSNWLSIIARLKPGISAAQAQSQLDSITARLATAYPETNAGSGAAIVPLALTGQDATSRTLSWFTMGLAGCVLLIACVNLANLQFARNAARAREHAIRTALGASRLRLIGQSLAESLLLALFGGALGLLVAVWTNAVLARHLVIGGSVGLALPLDFRVIGFAFAAAASTGLAFGLAPAWVASRGDVNDAVKQGGRGTTVGGPTLLRLRHGLIVTEIALALVLLCGAGFFLRGLERFTAREHGWHTQNLLTGNISLVSAHYDSDETIRAFYDRLLPRLAALPGVEAAALSWSLPISGFSSSRRFIVEGEPLPETGSEPVRNLNGVSVDFFDTLGISLVEGRLFTPADALPGSDLAIVNESMARSFWPGESAIGKRFRHPAENEWQEIVGVVADVSFASNLNEPDTPFQTYVPLHREFRQTVVITLRGTVPDALAASLRRAVAEVDPELPVHDIRSATATIARNMANLSLLGALLAAFALLGLFLAAVGIYGVIAGYVAQRTHEFGIRLALGAQVLDVLRLVLGQGLKLSLLGAALGLVGAFIVARLLTSLAPTLPPPELVTAGLVTFILVAIALLACWLPARRATKVDPMVALRAE
jgi:putative ABC transport system permease protein